MFQSACLDVRIWVYFQVGFSQHQLQLSQYVGVKYLWPAVSYYHNVINQNRH